MKYFFNFFLFALVFALISLTIFSSSNQEVERTDYYPTDFPLGAGEHRDIVPGTEKMFFSHQKGTYTETNDEE